MTHVKSYSRTPITVKKTKEIDHMLRYLEDKLLLNPTAVMRYCLARVYEEERKKDKGGKEYGRKKKKKKKPKYLERT